MVLLDRHLQGRPASTWQLVRPPIGDVFLVGGLLTWSALAILVQLPGRYVGVVTFFLLASMLPVLWRRRGPVTASAAHVAVGLVGMAWGLPTLSLVTCVLAYSVAVRRAPLVAVPVVIALAPFPMLTTGMLVAAGPATTDVAVATLGVLAAGGLGGAVRAGRVRVARIHAVEDRLALDAALDAERSRIGVELHEVVERRLHTLVEGAERLRAGAAGSSSEYAMLRRLEREAKETMTSLRRMLGLLRDAGHGHAASATPDPPPAATSRRPIGRRDVIVALSLVGLAVGTHTLVAVGPLPDLPEWSIYRLPSGPLGLLVLVGQLGPVLWRRRAPVPALLANSAAGVVAPAVSADSLVGAIAWCLLAFEVASRTRPAVSVPLVALGAACINFGWLLSRSTPVLTPATPASMVSAGILTIGLWVAGDWRRRDRAAAEQRRQQQRVRAERDQLRRERARIARDLHDVVAHHISGIAVQLGAARALATRRPELVDQAAAHVREAGRQTLATLPELLGALHLGQQPAGGQAPTEAVVRPRLDRAGVDGLVRPLRAAGTPVAVDVDGELPAESGESEVFAHRIVQEAVTNVLRHAGPSSARVRIEHHEGRTLLEVSDHGPVRGHRTGVDHGGYGILGMQERAALLGGWVTAGPDDDGGWVVRASLPR